MIMHHERYLNFNPLNDVDNKHLRSSSLFRQINAARLDKGFYGFPQLMPEGQLRR